MSRHNSRNWRRENREAFHFRKLNRRSRFERHRRFKQNRHHLKNKCRGGDFSPSNILMLKIWKHENWHRVFKNSDPAYIVAVLQRLMRMKHYKGESYEDTFN